MLTKRQEYLDEQLQKLVSKHDKTEDDADREAQLLEMRLTLTEERNAVMVPSAGSGIPGAPAEWTPVPGMETHIPVIFLDLNADDFSSQDNLDDPEAGGWDATLAGEEEEEFFELQIVKEVDGEAKVEASWDSAVHGCPQLSRGTAANERVFLIVRVTVQLSHPANMQLVLRKRVCVHVHGRQGFAQSLLKKMSHRSSIPGCGVTFEIVSNIPEDAQGVEERERLARMAASVSNTGSADSEAYIEKYLRSVLAVENLLTLDRLRQEVAVKEQLTGKGKLGRRSISSPSVNRLSGSRQDLIPTYSLGTYKARWESQQDVSQTTVSRGPAPTSSLPTCPPNHHGPDPGRGNPAPPNMNPVKSFVPQMPKLLKSLFPVRDEKQSKMLSPLTQQPVPRILVQPAQPDAMAPRMVQVPREPRDSVGSTPPGPVPVAKVSDRLSKGPDVPEVPEGPPSPLSEASSGYFSHSASSATLSDAPGLDTGAPSPASPPGVQSPALVPTSSLPPPPSAPAVPHKDLVGQQGSGEPGPKPRAAADLPASPFRIRKVRTSELQSFSRILGGDAGAGDPGPGKLDVSSDSEEATEVPEWLREGEPVTVGAHKTGVVRYVGPTDFQEGTWVGVELDLPAGKNDGCIGGRQYFHCRPGHGLLVRPGRVRRAAGAGAARRRSLGLRPHGNPEPRRSSTLSGSATNLASLTAALAKADGPAALRAERGQRHPENRKSWAS